MHKTVRAGKKNKKNHQVYMIYDKSQNNQPYMGLDMRKPVFRGLRTTKAQTSLRIRTVLSAPFLFAFWKVLYLSLLRAKFQISS